MSQATSIKYTQKIDALEKIINKLKREASSHIAKKNVSLRGILKGVSVSEADLDSAKASLFKVFKNEN